jgi:uncharacterized OB-fold protein
VPVRLLPSLNQYNRDFWTGGRDGELRIQRCSGCGYYIHPPAPVCRRCQAMSGLDPAVVSGDATVVTYSINYHPWAEGQKPYVMALVQLDEQADLRLVTNIVGCDVTDVAIGMRVHVTFESTGDVFVPLFAPAAPVTSAVPAGGARTPREEAR